MLFVIYGCHNILSSFWFLLTIHIFVRFNHLCSLWSFPLKPANKYPAVLGFLIEAHSRANPTTGFFLLTSIQQVLCVHPALHKVSPQSSNGQKKKLKMLKKPEMHHLSEVTPRAHSVDCICSAIPQFKYICTQNPSKILETQCCIPWSGKSQKSPLNSRLDFHSLRNLPGSQYYAS